MKGALVGIGRTAEVYEWGEGKIVKIFHDWLPYNEVELEARQSRIIAQTDLSVPQIYETVEIDGQHGIVYERIVGESMLYLLKKQPMRMPGLARQFADMHRRIHAAHTPDLPSQRGYLQWAIDATSMLTTAQKSAILRQLDALPDGDQVCHGDYHPDNLMITKDGAVVIDWIVGRNGNPIADVARTVVTMRTGTLPGSLKDRIILGFARSLLIRTYLNRYFAGQPQRRAEIQRWIPVIAAARLRELSEAECEPLLALVERGLKTTS